MDHKGSSAFLEYLAEWGIEKVLCITVDNAIANISAIMRFHREFSYSNVRQFFFFLHIRCCIHIMTLFLHIRFCIHIMTLIAKNGLGELGDNVLDHS